MAQLIICLRSRRPGFHPWVRKIPWKREWLPTLVFLPGEFDGQRFLEGHSAWGHKESDMSERLTFTPPGRDDESTGGCVCVCVCVCVRGQAGVCMECVGNLCTFYPAPPTFWSTFSCPTYSARPPPSCFCYLVLKDMSGSFYMILITILHDAKPSLSLILCVDLIILLLAVF